MATKAKRFRICVEGATTDGRAITREWISQMASGYDPKVYGARINLEHIKSVLPESSFRAYGDVTAWPAMPRRSPRARWRASWPCLRKSTRRRIWSP